MNITFSNFTDLSINLTTTSTTTTTSLKQTFGLVDVIVIAVYVGVFVVGVTGNLLVCFFFTLENRKLKHLELLIFYLAAFDLLASIFNPFLFIYLEATHYNQWDFGYVGCKLLPVIWKTSTSISYSIIMFISIERCFAIWQPFFEDLKVKTINKVIVVIAIISILLETPYLVYAEVVNGNICQVRAVSTPGYAYPYLIIHGTQVCLYITVFVTTYIIIRRELYKKLNSTCTTNRDRMLENKAVLKMLLTVAVTFVITVFPRELFHITYISSWLYGNGIILTKAIQSTNTILTALLSCNRVCNVFIYAKLHKRFRKLVKRKVSNALSFVRSSQAQQEEKNKEKIELVTVI